MCNADDICIDRPVLGSGQARARLVLRYYNREGDSSVTGTFGSASAIFQATETLPSDNRRRWRTSDGETCTYEHGTEYPERLANDQIWPNTLGEDAGKVTVAIAGSSVPIELKGMDHGSVAGFNLGWRYGPGSTPPPLKHSSSVYIDKFDPKYLPFGASFSVQIDGGQHVGARTLTGSTLPYAFGITSPLPDKLAKTPLGEDGLRVSWTPAQPSARMDVLLYEWQYTPDANIGLVRCRVRDDGEVIVPKEAIDKLGDSISVELNRDIVRYHQATTLDGRPLHIYLIGRHTQTRLARLEDKQPN